MKNDKNAKHTSTTTTSTTELNGNIFSKVIPYVTTRGTPKL